jgi:hypothetical protein
MFYTLYNQCFYICITKCLEAITTPFCSRNVAENQFDSLPTKGLQRLRHLKTFHNTRLQEPLPPDAFPQILTLKVAYAYHCCAFINQYKGVSTNFKLTLCNFR